MISKLNIVTPQEMGYTQDEWNNLLIDVFAGKEFNEFTYKYWRNGEILESKEPLPPVTITLTSKDFYKPE